MSPHSASNDSFKWNFSVIKANIITWANLKKFSIIHVQKISQLHTFNCANSVSCFAFVRFCFSSCREEVKELFNSNPQTVNFPKPPVYTTVYTHLSQYQIRLQFSHAQNYGLKAWASDRLINFYGFFLLP